jgi:hypothetical protein
MGEYDLLGMLLTGPLPSPLPEGEGTIHFPSPSGRGLGRGPSLTQNISLSRSPT